MLLNKRHIKNKRNYRYKYNLSLASRHLGLLVVSINIITNNNKIGC